MLKKISITIIILLTTAAICEAKKIGYVVGKNVNIRSKPTIKSKIIKKVNTGEKYEILKERSCIGTKGENHGHGWYKIKLSAGQAGWIYAKFFGELSPYIYKYTGGKIRKPALNKKVDNISFKLCSIQYIWCCTDPCGGSADEIIIFVDEKTGKIYPVKEKTGKYLTDKSHSDYGTFSYIKTLGVIKYQGKDAVKIIIIDTLGSDGFKEKHLTVQRKGNLFEEVASVIKE